RKGGNTELIDLLDEAISQAQQVYRANSAERGDESTTLSEEELCRVYETVGLGAVKYADLSQNRTSDYVFDMNKMMAMDGNTATYRKSAYGGNRSIFRRGNEGVEPYRTQPPRLILECPEERALALQLLRFSDALAVAAEDYKPNAITAYLWDLAKTY